ncbi:uncharacterized protein LOC116289799 [Actinia tenebrosa]|uniref:Uncharacterized protein LOC116289799 n=1 Tax=Actinia tenebrosa TaxID=6105 RepID=A0A6P8HIV4_ACTTE|nr:uncharacterized protein LOC116289799 [Actinia tenebrosa]
MTKLIHLAAFIFILSMVCADAFHIGVGKVGRRRKRTVKLSDNLQDALQDLCLFTNKHCNDVDSKRDEPQALAVLLMHARKGKSEKNVQKTLKIVCNASNSVCEPSVQRSKRSDTLLWLQEKKHRRPIFTVTS